MIQIKRAEGNKPGERKPVLELREAAVKTESADTGSGENTEEELVPFLSFPLLEQTGLVRHGFSTKLGGVR